MDHLHSNSNYYRGTPLIDTYPEFDHIYSSRIGFPGVSVVKKRPANAGDAGWIPGVGRSPGEGNGNPLQYSCLGNPMDRVVWWATVHGVTKSQT